MKINLDYFNQNYYQQGSFFNNWQKGIKILPFSSNPYSAFDKKCGLNGITGELFRILSNDGTKPIEDYDSSLYKPVSDYLLNEKQMQPSEVSAFSKILKDVFFINGKLNITDSAFLKYIPLVGKDEQFSSRDIKNYQSGQKKLVSYIYSMFSNPILLLLKDEQTNLFTEILKKSLSTSIQNSESKQIIGEYTLLPFVKNSFLQDIKWMSDQEETVKVKYFPLLFHFYSCYAVTQTIANLNPLSTDTIKSPIPFYFILSSEKASVNHDCVVKGWSHLIPRQTLDKLFGKLQTLDILNSILEESVGFYPDVYSKLNETPFEENQELCCDILKTYKEEKKKLPPFNTNKLEYTVIDDMDLSVTSYSEFFEKLERLCTVLQTPTYKSRMRKQVIDLMSVRFLQRRRGNHVLVLDNEVLTFLIALFTKSKKVKLEEMYKQFNSYGIYFNRGTRIAIEDYLLKLNLLDRKSDSGEAQYVTIVL